ncbi:HNH endonuclease [Azotobacter vinelandii]|uniref:HNH endonuclease n=1 Tax=Azotobacter vinelandii TaxID=354 RepID=UPI0026654BF9|nr:HNH endonuclease [Azotobacter vinelandii]WKN20813.1 HNH endonuclease [Azotobacter vinelandii]
MLSLDNAKNAFSYDAQTGVLLRSKSGHGYLAGLPAGTIRPDGRCRISYEGKFYYAHHIAWLLMTGEWPPESIDHKDGNPGNNAWDNLRLASHSQNMQNLAGHKDSTSRFPGVSFHAKLKKWRARLTLNRRKVHDSVHDTESEAFAAYCGAKAKYHDFNPVPRVA